MVKMLPQGLKQINENKYMSSTNSLRELCFEAIIGILSMPKVDNFGIQFPHLPYSKKRHTGIIGYGFPYYHIVRYSTINRDHEGLGIFWPKIITPKPA